MFNGGIDDVLNRGKGKTRAASRHRLLQWIYDMGACCSKATPRYDLAVSKNVSPEQPDPPNYQIVRFMLHPSTSDGDHALLDNCDMK